MSLTFTNLVPPAFVISVMAGIGSDVLAGEGSGNDFIIHKFSNGEWATLNTITGFSANIMDSNGSNVLLFGQTMPEGVPQIKKSTDGGQTWVTAVDPGVTYDLGTTPCYGFLSGDGGTFYSYNGDSPATAVTTVPNFSNQRSRVVGSEVYVMGANPNAEWTAAAYRSTNGGSSWIATDTPPARVQAACVANNTLYYLDDTSYTLYTVSEGVFSSTDTVVQNVNLNPTDLCGTSSRVYAYGSYFDMELMAMAFIWGYFQIASDASLPSNVSGTSTLGDADDGSSDGKITLTQDMTVEATGDLSLNVPKVSDLAGDKLIEVKPGGKLKVGAGTKITVREGTKYKLHT